MVPDAPLAADGQGTGHGHQHLTAQSRQPRGKGGTRERVPRAREVAMNARRARVRIWFVLIGSLLASLAGGRASAQDVTGAIQGTVVSSEGAPEPQVRITLTDFVVFTQSAINEGTGIDLVQKQDPGGLLSIAAQDGVGNGLYFFAPSGAELRDIFQAIADAVKMLVKEDIVPDGADRPVFNLAPILIAAGAALLWAVIPLGRGFQGADLNIGALWVVAIGSITTAVARCSTNTPA